MTLVIVQVLHQLYSLANGGGVAVFLGSIQPHESLSTWQMIFFPLLFNARTYSSATYVASWLRVPPTHYIKVIARTPQLPLPLRHVLQMYEYKRSKMRNQ